MLSLRERIYQITDGLERFLPHYEFAVMNRTANVASMDKALAALEAAQTALVTLLQPGPSKPITTVERITTLVTALAALARAKRVALLKRDALHSLVMTHLPADAAGYWANNAGELQGWICDQPPIGAETQKTGDGCLFQQVRPARPSVVSDELQRQDVLVWYHEPDRHFRLIDAAWLEAHVDIRAHVANEWEGGRRCRFCEMTEIGTSRQLIAVDPEQRSAFGTMNGVVVLQPGTVYVHERCAPYWERWRAIAQLYKTPEEAAEADRLAGRTSRVAPEVQPEPVAVIADTTNHFSAGEQYR